MSKKVISSRLSRKESQRLKRQTGLTLLLTVVALVALVIWGIPALIRMAIFLGELKNSSEPVDQQDKLAPPRPQLESLPAATKDNTISLKGFAESGSLVQLYRSDSKLKETIASDNGEFSFTGVLLKDGDNTFYVTATDTAGNESDRSDAESINYDVSAPILTIDSPQDSDSFFGPSGQTLNIRGTTDPDADIDINGHFSLVSSDGSFQSTIQLENGENKLTITATDSAGNQTTEELTVKYSQ